MNALAPMVDDRAGPVVLEGATVVFADKPALWNVTWHAPRSGLVAVVGPNGAGKSTLLKAALGLVPLFSGRISLLGGSLAANRKRIAYVPQRAAIDWDFPATARDVVAMGTYGRLGLFRRVTGAAKAEADAALEAVGLAGFGPRVIGTLSGGQQQRVLIARALAQHAEALFLDEPFVGVDQPSETAILELLERMRNAGRLVLCVHHDLDTVAERFDHVVLLATRLVAAGAAADVLTADRIREAYGPGHGVHGQMSRDVLDAATAARTAPASALR